MLIVGNIPFTDFSIFIELKKSCIITAKRAFISSRIRFPVKDEMKISRLDSVSVCDLFTSDGFMFLCAGSEIFFTASKFERMREPGKKREEEHSMMVELFDTHKLNEVV